MFRISDLLVERYVEFFNEVYPHRSASEKDDLILIVKQVLNGLFFIAFRHECLKKHLQDQVAIYIESLINEAIAQIQHQNMLIENSDGFDSETLDFFYVAFAEDPQEAFTDILDDDFRDYAFSNLKTAYLRHFIRAILIPPADLTDEVAWQFFRNNILAILNQEIISRSVLSEPETIYPELLNATEQKVKQLLLNTPESKWKSIFENAVTNAKNEGGNLKDDLALQMLWLLRKMSANVYTAQDKFNFDNMSAQVGKLRELSQTVIRDPNDVVFPTSEFSVLSFVSPTVFMIASMMLAIKVISDEPHVDIDFCVDVINMPTVFNLALLFKHVAPIMDLTESQLQQYKCPTEPEQRIRAIDFLKRGKSLELVTSAMQTFILHQIKFAVSYAGVPDIIVNSAIGIAINGFVYETLLTCDQRAKLETSESESTTSTATTDQTSSTSSPLTVSDGSSTASSAVSSRESSPRSLVKFSSSRSNDSVNDPPEPERRNKRALLGL